MKSVEVDQKIAEATYVEDLDYITGSDGPVFKSPEQRAVVESYDAKRVSRLRWKIDRHLIPACGVLYLLCFLDRGNIGNAKIAGMNKELGLSSHQYSVILTVFFATYCTVEAPCNILLKMLSAKVFLPLIAVLWGVCVLGMGFAKNYHHLIVLRILLGLFEAGLMPGCAYYLSNWYRPTEVSYRIALYFSAATIAGAFSGILAWAIMKMDGIGGLAGWSWIFILEGLLTITVGVLCYFFIYNSPKTCGFLTDEEITYWEWHLQQDAGKSNEELDNEPLQWKHIKQGAFHWRVWYMVILSLGCTVPIYSFSYFLPTIINTLGWTASTAQLMSAPPYIWACLCTIVVSYFSDKYKNRCFFIIGPMLFCGIVGFSMALGQDKTGVTYAGVFLACAGQYAPWPSIVSWNANNYPNSHTRGIAMGIQIGFASAGGIIASFIYRSQDSPRFTLGHSVVLGATVLGMILTVVLALYLRFVNAKKEKYCKEHPEVYNEDPHELAKLDEANPLFRYIY
ncbi:hypothetical protein D0Z00_003132 [Geotrichum galactomycetum]|uniref:Uncharacterized protein n=1 Tax=Geotrichum galactomycetum TaxID=27317 RepID=A0ACB6V277_9ASCO|nr:hypothetical protein D0Z00_003132 [Geotrichum candidum]